MKKKQALEGPDPAPEDQKPTRKTYHDLSIEASLAELNSDFDNGLSEEEALHRQEKYGKNELEEGKQKSLLQMIWDQLKDVMILVLLIAAVLSFVFQEWVEGGVILTIILVNTVIGVVQEKKAANAINSLKSMSAPQARVIRDGEEHTILANELVPGDIVYLEDGTIVPADMRIIESNNLKISEASLTGESVPSDKEDELVLKQDTTLGDRLNMAYSSSVVMYGTGYGIVTATGMNTEVGAIAGLLNNQKSIETPLKKKLSKIGKILSLVGLIIAVVIFVTKMSYGGWQFWDTTNNVIAPSFVGALMMALSLAISVIPEGLPATATIVMALGVQRMAKQNALVRKLPAVETLGSASVICSDKTGTLTLNKMTVTEIAINGSFKEGKSLKIEEAKALQNKKVLTELIYCSALCNNATRDADDPKIIYGDPTEAALLNFALQFGIENEEFEDSHERLFEQPFDSERKRMSVINKMNDDAYYVYTKGAVEELLPLCTHIITSTGVRKMSQKDIDGILKMNLNMSRRALRVLGYAYKEIKEVPEDDETDVENNLIFVGMTGMIDPPRVEVKDAIQTCHEAGIKVIMITGDHRITAATIARQLGILGSGNTVLDGDELDDLSDAELRKTLKTATVFARVSPSDKLRIVNALRANGEVVAMTGDGVNDSPALKSSDIGISMGITGTDVAKDASDMVLMDDNFTTIEYAVREGRRVYRNIQKVIQFLLAGNIAEVVTILFAALLNIPQPINAVQILVINLVTDTLPALALGVDPAHKDIMKEKPVKTGSLFDRGLVSRVIWHGLFIAITTMIAFTIGLAVTWNTLGLPFTWETLHSFANHDGGIVSMVGGESFAYRTAVTMAFSVLALSQLIHSANQRSNSMSIFSKGNGKNKSLRYAMLGSLLVMLVIMFVPVVNTNIFGIVGFYGEFGSYWWLYIVILALSFVPTILVELQKAGVRNKQHRAEQIALEKEAEQQALRDNIKQMVKEAVKEANDEARIISQKSLMAKAGETIYDENGMPLN